jgi:hypothetical protein
MTKQIVEDGWTPKYYLHDKVITVDSIARFYDTCLAKMCMDNWSINRIPAIVPLAALYFGVFSLKGHISLKNWAHVLSYFKLKHVPSDLHVLNGLPNMQS